VKTVGVRRGKNGHCPSVETGNKHQNFLENSTSAAQFRLIDVFLAMTVYFRYDTCTAQPDSLFWCQTVMSLPFIHVLCLQRQVTKFESGFFTVGLVQQIFSSIETVSADCVKQGRRRTGALPPHLSKGGNGAEMSFS